MVQSSRSRFDQLVGLLLPIAFVGSCFLNMYTFVLDGHRHEWFRQGVVLGVQAAAAICFFIEVCRLFRRQPRLRRPIALTAAIPLLFGVIHLWAILVRPEKGLLLNTAIVNGAYLVSACCAVVIIAGERRPKAFLLTCRNYALVLSPVVLYYCVRFYLPSAEYGVANLGVLNYMPLAYGLLEFCIFLLLRLLLAVWERGKPAFSWLDFALYTLFSIAITLSGTKGSILCLVWGGFLAVIYSVAVRKGRRAFVQYAAASLLAVALFSTAFAPDYGVENRVVAFFGELAAPESSELSMEDIHETTNIINRVENPAESEPETPGTQAPSAEKPSDSKPGSPLENDVDVVEFFRSGKAAEALASGQITQEEYDALKAMHDKLMYTATGGRKSLWLKAISEIKTAPVLGQGPYFYQTKYGTYPHNFFLELATDFGLPLTLAVAVLGLYVFIRLIRESLHSPLVAVCTFYVLAYLPRMAVGGSPYHYYLVFQYGLCVVLVYLIKKQFSICQSGV